jgi:hydroxymethylglutaryl-CoA reductase
MCERECVHSNEDCFLDLYLQSNIQGLKSVTNLNSERLARAEFEIPLSHLNYKQMNGLDVARRILEIYAMACEDPFRAVTHNKGIMNGANIFIIHLIDACFIHSSTF